MKSFSGTLLFAVAQFVWQCWCRHMTSIKQNSQRKPIWNARVSICGSILYKITSWQWMRAESIIHMETNKENNVSLPEWHVCSSMTAPAAASLPVGREPAGSPATCQPPTCTTPPRPHPPCFSSSLFSLFPLPASSHLEEKPLKEQADPQLAGLILLKVPEPWGFSVADVWQIIHRPK